MWWDALHCQCLKKWFFFCPLSPTFSLSLQRSLTESTTKATTHLKSATTNPPFDLLHPIQVKQPKKKSTSNIATPNPSPKINLKLSESQQIKGVHGSSWVELRGFFNITHHGGSEKFNPTQMSWVGSGWTHGLDNFFLLLLLLNWPKIYISYLPPELINKLIFQLSCKQNMFKYPTELINKI